MRYARRRRRFMALLNRFRWEDQAAAAAARRPFERVRSLLTVEDVQAVQSQGIDRRDPDLVLSLLALTWHPGTDGTGRLELVLAGDGAVALQVEALEARLDDVSRPYIAPSHRARARGLESGKDRPCRLVFEPCLHMPWSPVPVSL